MKKQITMKILGGVEKLQNMIKQKCIAKFYACELYINKAVIKNEEEQN